MECRSHTSEYYLQQRSIGRTRRSAESASRYWQEVNTNYCPWYYNARIGLLCGRELSWCQLPGQMHLPSSSPTSVQPTSGQPPGQPRVKTAGRQTYRHDARAGSSSPCDSRWCCVGWRDGHKPSLCRSVWIPLMSLLDLARRALLAGKPVSSAYQLRQFSSLPARQRLS